MRKGGRTSAFVVTALVSFSALQPAGEVGADEWRKLRATDFPARVQAVVFEGGVLDTDHAWVSGQWKARFPADPPIARLIRCDSAACPVFRVENFICENPLVGESRCVLALSWRAIFTEASCTFDLEKPRMQLPIRCPVDVRFK
ncbi:MAG: hypothetical protein HYY64_10100 [Candidatus Rokubacteria bacterium]|nr:hypothetical protein [Candidatus Rokubacteria bacterium]